MSFGVPFPYGKIDCYGISCNCSGKAVFNPNVPPSYAYRGGDALSVAEVDLPHFGIPGLPLLIAEDSSGKQLPCTLIVTSPNMDWVPDLHDNSGVVQIRTDGRFHIQDFTLWPQWHFPGTAHLTFVRQKPNELTLLTHPYRIMWYTLQKSDFIYDQGSIAGDVGQLRPDLISQFNDLCMELQNQIKALAREGKHDEEDYENMMHNMNGMQNAALALIHHSQTYFMTLATATSLQRHFLEGLACYEWWTIWRPKILRSGDDIAEVNTSIMGTITTQLDLTNEYVAVGVPVWLVRRPSQISSSLKVGSQVFPRTLSTALAAKDGYPGVAATYGGPPTSIRNRACQSLRIINIGLGHTAYRPQPGDLISTAIISARVGSSMAPMGSRSLRAPLKKIKALIAVNESKKLEPQSDLAPSAAPLWSRALQAIDLLWTRILDHDSLSLMRGYPVVDPYILAKSEGNSRMTLMYLVAWLSIRASWLVKVSCCEDGSVPLPDPQMWRTYLHSVAAEAGFIWGPTHSAPSSSSASGSQTTGRPSKRRRMPDKPTIKAAFGLDLPEHGSPGNVMWQEQVLLKASDFANGDIVISPLVQKQVIWDAFEHNFHLELLALDRCVMFRGDLDERGGLLRDDLVAEVFPETSLIITQLPTREGGLATRRWEDRRQYVDAFRKVLVGWPGSDANSLQRLNAGPSCTEQQVEAVEVIAYRLYCQTFFDYFGRPPMTPHQLPL